MNLIDKGFSSNEFLHLDREERKGVCIVTNYRWTANYGAILQAYALNAFLRSQGWECQTLNYCVSSPNRWQSIKDMLKHPRVLAARIEEKVLRRMVLDVYRQRSAVFDQFRKNDIPHTEECSDQNVQDIVGKFVALICGSDQIWRPDLVTGEFNDIWWLKPFPDSIPKLSYAASLGVQVLNGKQIAYIRDALKGYQAVSVREETAKELLEQACGRKTQVTLDPVFLPDIDSWRRFASHGDKAGKFILAYFIAPERGIYKRIEEFARQKNMRIVYMPYMGYKFNWSDFTLHGIRAVAATPQEFVGMVEDAMYVFTDSFHATAFSVMFHKNFNTFITNHGTRLKSLLSMVQLEDQIMGEGSPLGIPVNRVRWNIADARIGQQREASIRFLDRELSRAGVLQQRNVSR